VIPGFHTQILTGLDALRQGTVAAVSLMQPWISWCRNKAFASCSKSHSSRSEARSPQPYTRGRFEDTYNWTVKWNIVVLEPCMRKPPITVLREA